MSDLRTLLQSALTDAYTRGHSDGQAGPRAEMQLPEMSELTATVHERLIAPLLARIAELERKLHAEQLEFDEYRLGRQQLLNSFYPMEESQFWVPVGKDDQ